jgi:predicted dehydrogenase
MPPPIRIGIIGCGVIGRSHIGCYRHIPGVEVVACASSDGGSARATASEFGIPHAYAGFQQLVERADLDAVDVCLHNNLHLPATLAALAAGKHVYCEKPLAGSYHDAATMVAAARRHRRMLHVQLSLVFANETRAAKQLIDGGELGELYHARSSGFRRRGRPYVDGHGSAAFVSRRTAGGGALLDMGVYHLAQLLHLLGNPRVLTVSGTTYQRTAMDAARAAASGYDVEELALGLVRFAGGVTLDLIESWAMHLGTLDGSCLVGTKGGVRLAPFAFYRSLGDLDLDAALDLGAARARWNTVAGDGDDLGDTHRHWIAALQGRVELVPTAELALNAMLISEGIYLSSARAREVTAEEVIAQSTSTALPG